MRALPLFLSALGIAAALFAVSLFDVRVPLPRTAALTPAGDESCAIMRVATEDLLEQLGPDDAAPLRIYSRLVTMAEMMRVHPDDVDERSSGRLLPTAEALDQPMEDPLRSRVQKSTLNLAQQTGAEFWPGYRQAYERSGPFPCTAADFAGLDVLLVDPLTAIATAPDGRRVWMPQVYTVEWIGLGFTHETRISFTPIVMSIDESAAILGMRHHCYGWCGGGNEIIYQKDAEHGHWRAWGVIYFWVA